MNKLTDVLERFNRKERNLLVRDILGHSPEKGLLLSESFRERIGKALEITVPAHAWWATDYHLNWIAGAVAVWRDGEQANNKAYPNDEAPGDLVRHLVERNQEDADLLVAFNRTLILVEVKAFGTFTNRQIDSKVQRWELLSRFCKTQHEGHELTLHFMLMSRIEPKRLKPPPPELSRSKGSWPHVLLDVPTASEKLKVTGKGPSLGSSGPASDNWYVVRVSSTNDEDT